MDSNLKSNFAALSSILYYLGMVAGCISLLGCIEEIPLETQTFESALVVEATITDLDTTQLITLSRTFQFEEEGPAPESGAQISILDNIGNEYSFQESEEAGNYTSVTDFSLIDGRSYRLSILTSNGDVYESEEVSYNKGGSLDALYAERRVNDEGEIGVAFYIDSFDPTASSGYYRFEYEETYKIVSNFFAQQELIVTSTSPPSVILVPKQDDEYVCYNTLASQNINLGSTIALSEDRLEQYQVRFLKRTDPLVSARYSILVTQYVISEEAYSFYETLKNFSTNESLFSQVQPGFVVGNIMPISNPSKKVIGFFELATASKKRIFVNYDDIFSEDEGNPGNFAEDCLITRPEIAQLVPLLEAGLVDFLFEPSEPGNEVIGFGPFAVVPKPCMDCRIFGVNVPPDFWIE